MLRRIFLITAFLAVALLPTVALAAAPSFLPIVQCGGTYYDGSLQPPCDPCQIFKVVNNVTNLLLEGITAPVAAFMFVVSGAMMLLGAGNAKLQAQARTLMTNTALGVAIILFAWVGTNFLIKAIGSGSATDKWYEFSCPAYLQAITIAQGEAPAVPPVQSLGAQGISGQKASTMSEADMRALAAKYNEPYPYRNSPALLRLIACIYKDPAVVAIAFPAGDLSNQDPPRKQTSNTYTYDNENPTCNYSRGNAADAGVPKCSHSVYACHYGGEFGTKGAEAVDLNARGGQVQARDKDFNPVYDKKGEPVMIAANESDLFSELQNWLVTQGKCPDFKFLNPEGNHTHVSTTACDRDGKGVSGSSLTQ